MRKNVNFNFIMFIVAVVVAIITFVAFFFSFNKYSRNIDPLFDASSNSFETAWMTKHGLSYDVSTFATLKPDFDCEKPFNLMK